MVSEEKKYSIVKKILQCWNHAAGDFREGYSDFVIAKELAIPEIEVRTIRWDTIGDTRAEREKEAQRESLALEIIENAKKNRDAVFGHISALIETASEQEQVWANFADAAESFDYPLERAEEERETWSEIAAAATRIDTSLAKIGKGTETSEILSLDSLVQRKLTSIWEELDSIDRTKIARSQVVAIGEAVGWSPPKDKKKD
jgi:hypothetical protein